MANSIAGLTISKPTLVKPNFSMLIYGESGIGKTVLAGSAADVKSLQPALFVDVEGGVLSPRDFYPDVDVVRVKTWADTQKLYKEMAKGNHGYKTVIIDSLSEVQKFSLNEIMRLLVKEDPERDIDVPSPREWGKNLEQMRRFVRLFRDLEAVNTIFTAHATQEEYGKAQRKRTKVSLTGKLASEIAGFMDVVLYMYMKTDKSGSVRKVTAHQREDLVAKDRFNRLPPAIDSPTMEKVVAVIQNSVPETQEVDEDPEAILAKAAKS